MIRRFLLPASCFLLSASNVFAADVGVLILAHGGSRRWNRTVTQTVQQAQLHYPTAIAFGMGMHDREVRAIQQAVDTLERQGVHRLVVVPLLVSSSSDVMRQFEYLLRLRQRGPWETHAKPVTLHANVTMVTPLDDDPVVAEVLLDRLNVLSINPLREHVVVVAHGPNSDEDNIKWLEAMTHVTQQLQVKGRFQVVVPVTMRDDAPTSVQQASTRQLREIVHRESEQGRVLVVPLLLANGGIESKIPRRLKGLTYVYQGTALLPHPKLAQWLAQRVEQALASSSALSVPAFESTKTAATHVAPANRL